MKSRIIVTVFYRILGVVFIIISMPSNIYAQLQTSKAYPEGIYIFCGKELPKKFSYIIEKQQKNGEWKSMTELKAPQNIEECNARIQSLPASIASITAIRPAVTEFVWNRMKGSKANLDSLYSNGFDPRFQFVAGVAWFDEEVSEAGTYQYRISRLDKSYELNVLNTVSVAFPAHTLDAQVVPLRYKFNASSVELSYDVSGNKEITGIKLFRSPYLQHDYREVSTEMMFTMQKDKMVAVVVDKAVTNGLTYSYVAVGHDALGNQGMPSDTVNVYFVSKPADLGLITDITVQSMPDKGGNQLSWSVKPSVYVHSIDVFRSKAYDGAYRRLVSLSPDKKEYFDEADIDPAVSYFYYIAMNNGMGQSLPSARYPAILEGKRENPVPPQDLTLEKKNNVVTLHFRRVGHDVRGYYVYRADGYDASLEQLPRMLLATDSLLTYNDTLPITTRSAVYSYAVASINTSYNISPLSNRENISYSGGQLPVPSLIDAKYQDKSVNLIWTDAASYNNAIAAYQIARKVTDGAKEIEAEKIIGSSDFMRNYFEDKTVQPGVNYVYRVRCVTNDSTDVSSYSLPFSVYVPSELMMPPGDVSAIASDAKILLRWSLPISDDIAAVRIYRAPENGKETLLTELGANAENFEDKTAKKGVMYYYFIVLKHKNGQETKPSDPVSAKC